jgi:hypothetical protein
MFSRPSVISAILVSSLAVVTLNAYNISFSKLDSKIGPFPCASSLDIISYTSLGTTLDKSFMFSSLNIFLIAVALQISPVTSVELYVQPNLSIDTGWILLLL